MAAVTARLSAFWGAFLHLLLICVAGLGFEAPARLRAAAASAASASAAPAPASGVPASAAAESAPARPEGGQGAVPVCVPAQPGAVPERRAGAPARAATVPSQAAVTEEPALDVARRVPAPAPATPYQRAYVPAPRPYERERSLPPTMKQRIGAEAHGTSPSARSVAVPVHGLDGLAGLLAEAATAGSGSRSGDAFIPAARGRDRALCS
jgi:hypothetical protein